MVSSANRWSKALSSPSPQVSRRASFAWPRSKQAPREGDSEVHYLRTLAETETCDRIAAQHIRCVEKVGSICHPRLTTADGGGCAPAQLIAALLACCTRFPAVFCTIVLHMTHVEMDRESNLVPKLRACLMWPLCKFKSLLDHSDMAWDGIVHMLWWET